MIIDIREQEEEEIEGVRYADDTILVTSGGWVYIQFVDGHKEPLFNVMTNGFYDFMAACHKARELWGPK